MQMSLIESKEILILLFHFLFIAELKMDVLREREVKDNLERQLLDEQKLRGTFIILFLFNNNSNII